MQITPDSLKRLEKAYENAVAKHQDQFKFEGNVLVTNYAKYVIEYSKTRLEVMKNAGKGNS